jgi:prophage regulatory protein
MSNTTAPPAKRDLERAARQGVDRYLQEQATTAGKRILSQRAVLARVPVSRTTLWRLERDGHFPKRIQISANRVGWLESDVEAWMEERHGHK